MDVSIHSRGIEVPDDIRDYLKKKLERLDRHLHQDATGLVEVTKTGARSAVDRLVIQVTIVSEGRLLRGEQSGSDLHSAIDAVTDILDRQIDRFKGRLQRRSRISFGRAVAETEEAPAFEGEMRIAEGRLVRNKAFPVESMSPEDAVDEMELLGHDFYVFMNSSTRRLGVIYRRREGEYGLLDPQVS